MNRVLRKRLLRDLKSNCGRYLALVLLVRKISKITPAQVLKNKE